MNAVADPEVERGPRVAMVGAGQLARMTHQAAIDLGIELRVLAGADDDAAVLAGADALVAGAGDLDALRALADGCEVLTLDHENVPGEVLEALEDVGLIGFNQRAVNLSGRLNQKLFVVYNIIGTI